MPIKDRENLKVIRFNGELLPVWAQLLDVAARLCRVREETQSWFARFANSNGVDDSRTVRAHCWALSHAIEEHTDSIILGIAANYSHVEADGYTHWASDQRSQRRRSFKRNIAVQTTASREPARGVRWRGFRAQVGFEGTQPGSAFQLGGLGLPRA
jgi:hypothetical protein